jgi:hypothetical protein
LVAPHRDEENPDVHTNHTFPEQDNARCDSLSLKRRFVVDSEEHQELVYSKHMFRRALQKSETATASAFSHTTED